MENRICMEFIINYYIANSFLIKKILELIDTLLINVVINNLGGIDSCTTKHNLFISLIHVHKHEAYK